MHSVSAIDARLFASRATALCPMHSATLPVHVSQDGTGSLRMQATRLVDGGIQFTLEEYYHLDCDFDGSRDWVVTHVEFDKDGYPVKRGEIIVAPVPDSEDGFTMMWPHFEECVTAIESMNDWAVENLLIREKHEGSHFAWWVHWHRKGEW